MEIMQTGSGRGIIRVNKMAQKGRVGDTHVSLNAVQHELRAYRARYAEFALGEFHENSFQPSTMQLKVGYRYDMITQ